jgi:U3 small nucleolar RNA-associated protein MPP10
MAADSSPTLTSTSHTLTAAPIMASSLSAANAKALALLENLQPANRHVYLQPNESIPTDSLNFVKETLEAIAGQVLDEQQQRLKESRKRKRGGDKANILKVRKVYVDGFETNQVWQQAKRIIGGVLQDAEDAVDELEENNKVVTNGVVNGVADSDTSTNEDNGEERSDLDLEDVVGSDEDDEHFLDEEAVESLEEDEDEEVANYDDDYNEQDDSAEEEEAGEFVEDPDGLNDGFFSLEEFNRQSQWFEEQDARGDPNTDRLSDEEDIDWDADPYAPTKSDSKPSKAKEVDALFVEEDEEDDDDEGPTFGNMALDAPEGDSENEDMDEDAEDADDMGMNANANDIFYKDFFAPPPRKRKHNDKPKKTVQFKPEQPDEAEVERAMADVRRDLFEDESDNSDEDALSDVSAGDPKSRRSAHERRQAKIAEEIRKLEAASVAKREWTLSGEAAAVDRPVNSLLEEDLDFEHIGKPVPVITPDVSESIEDLIKRRILAQEFNEVIRRRPDAEGVPTGTRRGVLEEVQDTKGKGLAEVYEEEHARRTDPDAYVSKSDEKVQREEREIEAMWRDVSARLDALSSWHYRPKPAEPTLSVVADVATVAMEDAQPATAQGVAGESSRLAPQEVYAAGAKGTLRPGEVATRSGLPVARQEMSREDKLRRRRRDKERLRKAGGLDAGKNLTGKAKMQKDTLAELKKGGVKVINRKGEVTDVDGNKAKAPKTVSSGNYKL